MEDETRDSNQSRHELPNVVRFLPLILLAASICWFVFSHYIMDYPPVSQEKIDSLRIGMTREQVMSVLGKPSLRREGGNYWIYSRPELWYALHVYFDKEGQLKEFHLDD
jgi:outer membrane protein assembly factor BamE (lipoprotein component of BamABCDE complex)